MDFRGIAPLLEACKATVLTFITKSPNHLLQNYRGVTAPNIRFRTLTCLMAEVIAFLRSHGTLSYGIIHTLSIVLIKLRIRFLLICFMFQTAEPASDYFATANYIDIGLAELSAMKMCDSGP